MKIVSNCDLLHKCFLLCIYFWKSQRWIKQKTNQNWLDRRKTKMTPRIYKSLFLQLLDSYWKGNFPLGMLVVRKVQKFFRTQQNTGHDLLNQKDVKNSNCCIVFILNGVCDSLWRPRVRNNRGLKPVKDDLTTHSPKIRHSNYIAILSKIFLFKSHFHTSRLQIIIQFAANYSLPLLYLICIKQYFLKLTKAFMAKWSLVNIV